MPEAARLLAELRQGECTVTDYSIEFSTLAAECGWNSEAQWDMFLYGLCDVIKDEIYSLDLPTGVDKLIDLAIRVDTRLRGGASRHSGDCRFFHRVTFHQFLTRLCFLIQIPSPCRWEGPVFHSRRSGDAGRGDSACIVELPVTSLCSVQ